MNTVSINLFPPLNYQCAEAVNMLCTNLSFSGANVKKILLTSCHQSEGKSFLTMNIMRTMASLGKRVVLVDADLRRSVIATRYGLQFSEEKPLGLSHYLAGMADERMVIYETSIPNAYMIPVGRKVNNSLPLLNSERFQYLLNGLAKDFDYVLVDAPPIGLVIDAAQIAKYCDGTVLVVGYNEVRRQELIDAKAQIDQTGCPILGAVLNQTAYDNYLSKKYSYKSYYSHYGYYSKYSDEEPKDRRKRFGRSKKKREF